MKDFFAKAPPHDLKVGDLVTCNCHGGIAALTLVRNNVDDYINKNYNSMKNYIERGGSNNLLSKPQGIK